MIIKDSKKNYDGIAIVVPNEIPNNSIFLQANLLKTTLVELVDNTKIPIVSTQNANKHLLSKALRNYSNIIYHYGSFDPIVNRICKFKNAIFVYHNVTPAKYFWNWEPKVSIRSLISLIQLKSLPKDIKWVAVSTFNADCLKMIGFKNVIICPLQINTTNSIKNNIFQNENQLVYVGRISPNKNCIKLLEQVNILVNHIEKPIKLIIVGNYKENSKYLNQFKNILEKLKKSPKISINWYQNIVSKKQLDEIYLTSTLFISMSLHEGFGLPICEAIALGCPGIYLECGGIESILDNVGMVKRKEEEDFYKYIDQMIHSQSKRDELLKMQKKIVTNYLVPEINKKIAQTYLPLFNIS